MSKDIPFKTAGNISKFKVEQASRVPIHPHLVILHYSNKSVYHEGDERSRTHPGHGYPAHTENFLLITQYVFPTGSRQAWQDALTEIYADDPKRTDIVAYEVTGKVVPKISISF